MNESNEIQPNEAQTKARRFFIREPFCGLSHGLGAALSVAALIVLLILAHGKLWQTISFAVFGVSLIVLYTASTLYHSLWVKPQQILKLMRFDHVAIFLLIAGTYAPVCLVGLRGVWGWTLFGVEYGLAVIGIVCSLVWKNFPDWARITIYLAMGWLIAIAMVPPAPRRPARRHRLALCGRHRLLRRHRRFRHRQAAPVARQVQRPRPVAHLRAGGQRLPLRP